MTLEQPPAAKEGAAVTSAARRFLKGACGMLLQATAAPTSAKDVAEAVKVLVTKLQDRKLKTAARRDPQMSPLVRLIKGEGAQAKVCLRVLLSRIGQAGRGTLGPGSSCKATALQWLRGLGFTAHGQKGRGAAGQEVKSLEPNVVRTCRGVTPPGVGRGRGLVGGGGGGLLE